LRYLHHERSYPVHDFDGFRLRSLRHRRNLESGADRPGPYQIDRCWLGMLESGDSPRGVQTVILLIIILILVFGFGGWQMGPGVGWYGGGGIGLILLIVLIVLLLGGRL
jgi:hypothetical protein